MIGNADESAAQYVCIISIAFCATATSAAFAFISISLSPTALTWSTFLPPDKPLNVETARAIMFFTRAAISAISAALVNAGSSMKSNPICSCDTAISRAFLSTFASSTIASLDRVFGPILRKNSRCICPSLGNSRPKITPTLTGISS